MKFEKLLVIIPTRNRSAGAIRSINSVLAYTSEVLHVAVSDNSTESEESQKLNSYVENLGDNRVSYLRPPEPLRMTEHYDWALNQCFQITDWTHVIFLTDRVLFRHGTLSQLVGIITEFDDVVVSYCFDGVNDLGSPVFLLERQWTGKIYRLSSKRLLEESSKSRNFYSIPRIANCSVPREVLETMRDQDGYYFSSVSPDYNFAYRCLDTVNSILFFDKSIMLDYNLHQSNGASILSGKFRKDAKDFLSTMESNSVCFETPVNEIRVLPNALLHEYFHVKQTRRSDKFPPLKKLQYITSLIENVFSYGDQNMRNAMIIQLDDHFGPKLWFFRLYSVARRGLLSLTIRLYNRIFATHPYLKSTAFASSNDAVEYALHNFREPESGFYFLEERTGLKIGNCSVVQVSE